MYLMVLNDIFRGILLCWLLLDEPSLLGQSCQSQAVEDILDKYRNIKRTSPSEEAKPTTYDPGNLVLLLT